METIEVDGEEFELNGDPSMGTVKYVQNLQIDTLRKYVDDEAILKMDSQEGDAVMEALTESEGGLSNMKDLMWENNLMETVQTIILATDHKFALTEFEDMSAMKFREMKERSEVALGNEGEPQTASDFMQDLGIGISSKARQMARQRVEERRPDSETSSQSPLLTE